MTRRGDIQRDRLRRENRIGVCPTHPHVELQRVGGQHHAGDKGWCEACKAVVQKR